MITAPAARLLAVASLLAVACLLALGLLAAALPASAEPARTVAPSSTSGALAGPAAPTSDGQEGGLAGPPAGRRLGLPVAVAVVAVLGVASLLVRVLLAEPQER